MNSTRLLAMALVLWLPHCQPVIAQQTPSEKRTFEQVKARADKGDVEAQLALAEFYAEGIIVPRDLSKAAKWHRKAADQGSAKGQLLVGEDLANGVGVKPDKVEAVRWLRRAAEAGLPEAQYDLATCFANGEGVKANSSEAVKYYRLASEKNFTPAKYELGRCYLEGNGVAKNVTDGVQLIRDAAEKGYGHAQHTLGLCYSKGDGVPKDNLEAYKWLVLAAAQEGDQVGEIKVNLAKVERFLSVEQVAEGQRLAREFQPRSATRGTPSPTSTTQERLVNPEPTSLPKTVPSEKELKYGALTVQSELTKAEIYVDGAFVGNPPARLKLPEGSHTIEMKGNGSETFNKRIMITEGCQLTLTF